MVVLGERLCLSALLMARRSFIFTLPGESLDLYLTQMSFTLSSVLVDIFITDSLGMYSSEYSVDSRMAETRLTRWRWQVADALLNGETIPS